MYEILVIILVSLLNYGQREADWLFAYVIGKASVVWFICLL